MNTILERVLELAKRIQQVPAPTFKEGARAALARDLFEQEGLSGISLDPAGNVYACLPSAAQPEAKNRPVVLSAHLDTVFPDGVEMPFHWEAERLYGPGIGDNSLGLAGLFGLVWLLRKEGHTLPYDLWLVANTCEEGLGDLHGMKAVVERFGSLPLAYIILEGMALGHVYHRGLGVRRYRISVETRGGHSWVDHGQPSAIHELATLAAHLTSLEIPRTPRTTLNIGIISGGTSVNTIAAQASLELDLRSESPAALEALALKVEQGCRERQRQGVQVRVEVIGARPAGEIAVGHPLVSLACACLRAQGVQPVPSIGSTDANIPLSRGLPAVTLGLTTGAGAHTVHEYVNVAPLEKGLRALLGVVLGLSAWGDKE